MSEPEPCSSLRSIGPYCLSLTLWVSKLKMGESSPKSGALLQAAKLNLSPVVKILLLFRHYDRGFSAPLGNGFGASSRNSGETGLYIAADCIAGRNCEVSLFADYYQTLAV